MLLPSIGAQQHKKACTGRFLRRLCLFLIFHKGSQIAHRADPLQVVIRPFDAEFLLQGKHQITEIRRLHLQILQHHGVWRYAALVACQLLAKKFADRFKNHG